MRDASIAQSQRIVVPGQLLERAFQAGALQPFRDLEQEGLVVVLRLREALLEKPVLNRRQRRLARNRSRLRGRLESRAREGGQFDNLRVLEQLVGFELQGGASGAGDDLDARER